MNNNAVSVLKIPAFCFCFSTSIYCSQPILCVVKGMARKVYWKLQKIIFLDLKLYLYLIVLFYAWFEMLSFIKLIWYSAPALLLLTLL